MTELGNNSRFAVIGYGSWATTIVGKLTQNGRHVNWHVRNPEVIEGVLTDGYNPKYVSDMELERSLLFISQDINEIVAASDIVILCVPSAYLKKTMEDLNPALLKGKFVISAVKGIIPDDYTTVLEFVHDKFGLPFKNLGLISGPSHAEEVSRGKLSYLTIACNTIEDAEVIALAIRSDTLRISTSTDIYGIEYAAIMKNIYAIVLKAQLAGIAAARAGIPGKEIDGAARKVIVDAGFGQYFGHGFGHSLGLDIHEAPSANPSGEALMPVGAVVSAEPGIYLPGKFGVRIEDVMVLNETGCEVITKAPKEQLIIL